MPILLSIFGSSLITGFSGAVMPGSLFTYCVQGSLKRGKRTGFELVAGHALLELLLVILLTMGLDTVLKAPAAQIIIGAAGGALLIWMGGGMILGAIKNSVKISTQEQEGAKVASTSLKTAAMGVALSASNPYFILWWAAVGMGMMLEARSQAGVIGVAAFFFGHILSDFIWYGFISVLIGSTRRFIGQTFYRWLIALLGCALVYFGSGFIYGAVEKLILIW